MVRLDRAASSAEVRDVVGGRSGNTLNAGSSGAWQVAVPYLLCDRDCDTSLQEIAAQAEAQVGLAASEEPAHSRAL